MTLSARHAARKSARILNLGDDEHHGAADCDLDRPGLFPLQSTSVFNVAELMAAAIDRRLPDQPE
jgi:hypothetical protein